MDSLDLVTIITYICGILGGILLVLCIVLAFLFIVVQCKAYFCPRDSQYSVVPIAQNGVAIENGFNSKKGYVPGDDPHQEPLLSLMDESGNARKNGKKPRIIRSQHENHSQPPVKKKLLWKKGRKKSITRMPAKQTNEDEKVEFSDEDLDVPRDRIFRKNPNVIRFKSRSKSDWDIHDMPGESPINSSEEDFAAYTRNLRLLQNGEEVGLSQYFDALETINEVTEGEEEAPEFLSDKDSGEWEDIITLEEIPEESSSIQMKRFLNDSENHHRRRSQDPQVRRRLKALHRLQLQSVALEAQFYRDVAKIEANYMTGQTKTNHSKLRNLINGKKSKFPDGIPRFWLLALKHSETLGTIIQGYDEPVLEHLVDIRIRPFGQMLTKKDRFGFALDFEFEPNEYFSNEILTKEYEVRCRPNIHHPFSFEGPEISNCTGCKIHWERGKNVTLKAVKRVRDGDVVQKWAKRNSFFNFFTPPILTKDVLKDQQKAKLLQAHFEIGLHFKETFIPNSVGFFLDWNKAAQQSPDESIHQTRRKRIQSDRGGTHLKTVKPKPKINLGGSTVKPNDPKPMGSYTESEVSIASQPQAEGVEAKPKDLPSQPSEPDPIIGRYRMTSSDGFDEVLRELGVGLMKRKMANSVTPINVIEIDEEGTYVIKTETTLRTTEIRFKMEETFIEVTLDGRTTHTYPTRKGNVIHLDQRGDPIKKEKDSVMIRDFQGDIMHMQIIVGQVVCKRVYERIKED
ncbi:hypothetical protein TCAL_02999 [Tigriopus californicus]|uniref:Cytosolic fatty-acid binding proteins domain-containing protein n=1 Tax=Tigriopus californicus TaxID=6832 RepID=A0A553PRQ2_TIGCA|nr:hypothetical protein TCAL_02999 [Tigriopus californicus]